MTARTVLGWLAGAAVVGCLVLAVYVAKLRHRLAETQRLVAPTASVASAADDAVLLRQLLAERDAALAQLQAEYAALRQQLATLQTSRTVSVNQPATNIAGRSPVAATNSWLERLRIENPERYRRLQVDVERRRQALDAQFEQLLTRLEQRLQQARTTEEAELLTALAESIGRLNELRSQLAALRGQPMPDRMQQWQELMQQSAAEYQRYGELRAQDRQLQMRQLAAQIGYHDAAEAQAFVDEVQRIYVETDASLSRLLTISLGPARNDSAGGSQRGAGP